jgi:hypothetical protein
MPSPFGDRYGASKPCCCSITARSGSLAQNTSACGCARSATIRSATPVLFVSSVSYTARTLMPLVFSKSFRTGSEKTWSSEV